MKLHLEKFQPNYKDKDLNFFKQNEDSVKRQPLGSTGEFQQNSGSIVETSFLVSL